MRQQEAELLRRRKAEKAHKRQQPPIHSNNTNKPPYILVHATPTAPAAQRKTAPFAMHSQPQNRNPPKLYNNGLQYPTKSSKAQQTIGVSENGAPEPSLPCLDRPPDPYCLDTTLSSIDRLKELRQPWEFQQQNTHRPVLFLSCRPNLLQSPNSNFVAVPPSPC